jgi:hypothetical protein
MEYRCVWDREYVYNAEDTEDFRQVRILLESSDTTGRVTLLPHQMMTMKEISAVMKEYEDDVLKRMLTPYDSYYPVRLVYNDVECKIEFDSQRRVTGLNIV